MESPYPKVLTEIVDMVKNSFDASEPSFVKKT